MKTSSTATNKRKQPADESFIITKNKFKKMKKLVILSAIAMSGLIYNTANAQIGVRLGLNLGQGGVYARARVVAEPDQVYEQTAPVYNNSDGDDYYYLPDVDAYYNVTDQCYFYFNGESWISAAYLPGAYRDYDWRNSRRFEVRAQRPYLNDDLYRSRYNGRPSGQWAGNNSHFDGGYANRRGNDQHFDNGGNRGNDQHFDNRRQGSYGQSPQQNRENGQHFDNRGQGGYSQPSQPNRGQGGQPSNQNRGQNRDNRGGNDRFSQNNPKGGYGDHKMNGF
jgi:hypothetical protein